jgi:signal transduction histidine kinase
LITRRLSIRLLAPTVVVSFLLVTACACGMIYLSSLHFNVASDLSENVQSTQTAARLEATSAKLVAYLRTSHPSTELVSGEVEAANQEAARLLDEAQALANHDKEQRLVAQIRQGLDTYLARWRQLVSGAGVTRQELAQLVETSVLAPAVELRHFNADLVQESDRENRAIVDKLRWGLLVIGIGLPLGGLVFGYAVARRLRHSIFQLSVRIRDAAGRLNRELASVTLEEETDLHDLHRQVQGITLEIENMIKQLQQREREVLRAEQMAAVGQVAAGVAHELRNPLTSVKMLVQTALEPPASDLSRDELRVIEREVRRMEQCIQVFLDFARPPDAERRRSDLAQVIREAIALVEGRASRQQIDIRQTLPAAPVELDIDPEQIRQVLVNLLLNAFDAMPHGGSVNVMLSPGSGQGDGAEYAQVSVRDRGSGITPRVLDRLFDPFVSGKENGLGLGLSICKRLIEAHGGSIEGRNVSGGGAEFMFRLPRNIKPVAARHEPAVAVTST